MSDAPLVEIDLPEKFVFAHETFITPAAVRMAAQEIGVTLHDYQIMLLFGERLDVLQAVLAAAMTEGLRSFLVENIPWAAHQ